MVSKVEKSYNQKPLELQLYELNFCLPMKIISNF